MTNSREAVRSEVWRLLESRHDELVDLCRRLVRIPSRNGTDTEREVAAAIGSSLRERDLPAEILAFEPDRPTVLSRVGGGDKGLVLVGHTDTVAIGERESWSSDPLEAEIRDGKLYGRGACDNKAGIAVSIVVLSTLRDAGADLAGVVQLACVPDEESGASGRLGIVPLLRDGHLAAAHAIYTYPNLDVLSIGHRGLLRVRTRAIGQPAHTGGEEWESGSLGANAVTALAEVLLELERWEPPFRPSQAFPGRRPVVTPGTLISGGKMASMVPEACEAVIDMRLLPGQAREDLLGAIDAICLSVRSRRPGIRFELATLVDIPAVSISTDEPIVRSLAHWTEVLTGTRPILAGAGPANEGYLLIRSGIPTVCGFGPPGRNAHAADEYVEVEGLLTAAKIYAATALDLVGAR